MSISFLLDEKPSVVPVASARERSGGDDRQVRRYNQGSSMSISNGVTAIRIQ
jgi:hypothetical protein